MSTEESSFSEEVSNNMLKELQSWWEIPSMAQYISLFREPFHLPEIEIEELEKGFIDDTIRGPNEWLQNLVIAFLKSIMPGRVNAENWEDQLRKLVRRKWSETPYSDKAHPFEEDKPFHQLQLRSKVEIVYSFCLCRLDKNDIVEQMKSMDADALRVQKLGTDDSGNTYWYFYGTRLYKEEPVEEQKSWDEEWKEQKRKSFKKKRGRGRPRKRQTMSDGESDSEIGQKDSRYMNVSEKSRWSVVCDTIEEWVNFAEKFKNSKSKTEKNLFQIIQENFLPTLNQIYEEKERKLQEKIRELMPAREKIVTRTEARRLRGDDVRIDYSKLNGYYSDEEEQGNYKPQSQPQPQPSVIKDRAQRLEERKKRANEANVTNGNFSTTSNKKAKPYMNDSDEEISTLQIPEGREVDIQSEMEKILTNVKLHKDAWPFLYPVSEEDAPGYYEIIKDPIDLSKIENRLYNGDYETVGDLDSDFSKMVSNCELYNGEYHAYSKMAQTLRKMFRKQVAKILETLEAVENEHLDSEGSRDGQTHSSSNSASSAPESPPMHLQSSKEHKKSKHKKRKRGSEALDLLAQASEIAVQNSNSNDMLGISNLYDEQKKSNDFPNLKIFPIHSHPPSYVEKYSSNSPKENTDINLEKNSSFLNQTSDIALDHGQQLTSSPSDSGISTSSETVNYMHNLTHLSNLMEKNGVKNLNLLSNGDTTNVLSDSDSSNNGSVKGTGYFQKDLGTSESLHGLDNILVEYPENLISHLMKQPIYNSDGLQMSQSKDNFSPTYIGSFSKGDMNSSKAAGKSPNFVPTTERIFFQENPNIQYDLGSPSSSLSTIDASVLGISLNSMSKKPRHASIPTADENLVRFENNEDAIVNSTEQEATSKNCHSFRLKQRASSNDMNQNFEPPKIMDMDQNVRSKQRSPPSNINQYFQPHKIMDMDQNVRSKQRSPPTNINQCFEPPKIMDMDQNVRSKQRSPPNNINQYFEPPKIMDMDQNVRSKQRSPPNNINQYFEPPKFMDVDQNVRSKQKTPPNINQYFEQPKIMEKDQNVRSEHKTLPNDMNKSLESNFSGFDQNIRLKQRISTNNINQNYDSSNNANCDQTVRPSKRTSPNETNQYLEPYNNMQAFNVSNSSYQSYNLGVPNPQNILPTTFIQTLPTYSSSNMPLQVPALYPKSYQPLRMQMQSENNSVRVNVPPSNDQPMFLPRSVAEQTMFYHMYTQKQRHNSVQDHINALNDVSAVSMQVASNDEKRVINQDNSLSRTSPPQKKSPEPQEKMAAPVHVPSTSMPFNPVVSVSTTTSNRTSLPVSSSNSNLANPAVQGIKKNRPVIITAKVAENSKRTSPNNNNVTSTSLNSAIGAKNSSSSVPQKSVFLSTSPKTVPPIVISGYNSASPSDQSNLRIKNSSAAMTSQSTPSGTMTVQSSPAAAMTMQSNSAAVTTMQSNVCMPNRLPVVQQVIIPAGSQQFQIPSNGQFVLASPQNTVNLYAKDQNVQTQNNVGQLNQSFGKVVPQYLASAPIMQVSKDGMQNLQFQTLTQSTQPFTQVTQSPQFVNIPYMLANQNVINNPSSQTVMNLQPFQLTPRQVQISSQGNG